MPFLGHKIKIAGKRVFILFILSFLVCSNAIGQQEGFIVSGTVWDKNTGAPVENVNISLKGSGRGTISNSLGVFQLRVKTLPFFLELSHVSYTTKIQSFEHKPLQDIQVFIEPKSELLSEITITSQKIDTLYADRIYSVLDYELLDEGILLLIFKSRLSRAELLLKDYSGNTLLRKDVLPMKPLTLFKDCLGEVHILAKDKAYQVLLEENKMWLYPPVSSNYFWEVMSSCKFKIGEKVYFEDFEFHNLIKKYYYVSTIDTSSHLLAIVGDEEKISFLKQNPENYQIGVDEKEQSLLGAFRGVKGDTSVLNQIRKMTEELRFNKMAYLSKIYAPAYPIKDSIAIFNHPGNVIEFYNTSDTLIGKTEIEYHHPDKKDKHSTLVYAFAKSSKWLQEIYVDQIQNKAYTLYQKINGTRDLMEINLKTGEVTYKLNIPFPYVQKIKVRDDNIYFVYKGYVESSKKKLFRQNIR